MAQNGPAPDRTTMSRSTQLDVQKNPRRQAPERSVSLVHLRPAASNSDSQSSGDSNQVKRLSTAKHLSSRRSPLGKDGSSGESSNAEKWFETSNNAVRQNSGDNEPPFFMRNSSSEETPPDQPYQSRNFQPQDEGAGPLFRDAGHLQGDTEGSSTEDYRAVIDDLTVENKKLKRRLKRYAKLHDSRLKDQKLFEVRMHGLAPDKKRELEETLQRFARSLNTPETAAITSTGYTSVLPTLKTSKTTSSQSSLRNADSAYASMSASGQGSSAQYGNENKSNLTPRQQLAARRQNVHSYLHDVPDGLMPQQDPALMPERAKKKLVVRRMEQIFAGKGKVASGQQFVQQEEVSRSAAQADWAAVKVAGQQEKQEGSREAKIMEDETEDPLEQPQHVSNQAVNPQAHLEPQAANQVDHVDFADALQDVGTLDQRPTRPIDLDPQRAQVPADNVRYLRQMGFSPLDPESQKAYDDGHGWIYLNFLINMAQLHTINVTSDFVRKALYEHSDKFEVSSDGRKVRWRGGKSVTRTSSHSGGVSHAHVGSDTPDEHQARKRVKLDHTHSPRSDPLTGQQWAGGTAQRRLPESNKLAYTPMFVHRGISSEDSDDSPSADSGANTPSSLHAPVAVNSSAMTSSVVRQSDGLRTQIARRVRRKKEQGPIIFYDKAPFCTDLSGDPDCEPHDEAALFPEASEEAIGNAITTPAPASEKRGPLATASELPDPMDLDDNPIPDSKELSMPPSSPLRPSASKARSPVSLEASGVGGVWPTDNFAIHVQHRYPRVDAVRPSNTASTIAPKALPPRLADILEPATHPRPRSTLRKEAVSRTVQNLPPSELPPPMDFMALGDHSPGTGMSEADEEMSEAPGNPSEFPPSAALQPFDISYASSEDGEPDDNDDSEGDEADDGVVDFLAAVRQVDPETVRAQEREFDANVAEALAEEIPVGSSAATAGGGSGFASPAEGISDERRKKAMREARARAVHLRRSAESGSMVVQGDVSDGEDGDEGVSNIGS